MTDTTGRRPSPRLGLSGLEWKLGLTAILSAAYALSLVAFARAPAIDTTEVGANGNTPTIVSTPVAGVTSTASLTTSQNQTSVAPRAVRPRIRTRSS